MTLADAVAIAKANAASGRRGVRPPPTQAASHGGQEGGGGGGGSGAPAPKTLVEVHAELQEKAKVANQGKAEWEGQHPWRPFDRDKDLDIRAAKPKAKETILNNNVMGTLGDRFGGSGRSETRRRAPLSSEARRTPWRRTP